MSNESKVYVHELIVRLECDEHNNVNWRIGTDDVVRNTLDDDYEALAMAGAPLSALGVRVLRDLLGNGLLELALDKANNYVWKSYFERHAEICGVAHNDAEVQWLAQQDAIGPVQ